MITFGINCLNHDAAITVLENDNIVFAAHSERYSRKKNDSLLNEDIVNEALKYGSPDKIIYYEKPYLKKLRQLYSGQFKQALSTKNLPKDHLKKWFDVKKIEYVGHHESHAAAGYFTSPYKEAIIVVIDAIGEWDVLSVWKGKDSKIEKIYSIKYPHSLGLFYSAVTKQINLKPCEEEYILMGMSAWGKETYVDQIYNELFDKDELLSLKYNLHRGLNDYGKDWNQFDFATSTQKVTEIVLDKIFNFIKKLSPTCDNLVYMGGVALNCVANSIILPKYFKNIWIMPNPGDAGSSMGAAALGYGSHLKWSTPLLGTNIDTEYPIEKALNYLEKGQIFGIASGRAEFGPRALGNRSLLADPRGSEIKDKVNKIKKRQEFRPFAPAILEEFAHEIFEMPVSSSPYMQFVAKCKYPSLYPAICHRDNTSRVQTVSKSEYPNFYQLLKEFYNKTGCPMLLNTSLNIKGQPIVNNKNDANEFENFYNVPVI